MDRRDFLKTTALAGAALGVGLYGCKPTTKEHFDTLIKDGTIYTGDGGKPFKGDIGIKDGKIAAIGNLGKSAEQIVDAKGLAVSPGFVDIHSHSDSALLDCPLNDSRIYQGITTEIGGNCGGSPFPYSDSYYLKNKDTLRKGYPFWQNIDGFYDALRKNKLGVNYGSFVGHGDIRSIVVGDNDVEATPEQIEKMKALLEETLEKGAVGLSVGLEYAPGSYATNKELVELQKVVAKHNKLYAVHNRNEDNRTEEAVKEVIDMAREAGVRVQQSHLKALYAPNWHKAESLMKMIEDAHNQGVDIAFDRYPYIAYATSLRTFIPLKYRQGSNSEVLARLKDREISKLIGEYTDSRIAYIGGPQNVLITQVGDSKFDKYTGKSLKECCEMTGLNQWEFIRTFLIDDNLRPDMVAYGMKEENVKLFLSHPLGMPASDGEVFSPVGVLSNATPHPRSYGTFPRFLGKYVREGGVCSLAEGIKKCTSLPASRVGLKDRGLLSLNYNADIVIFNPDTIIDTATFQKPHQFPIGIKDVFVNGAWTIKDGKATGALAGSVLEF